MTNAVIKKRNGGRLTAGFRGMILINLGCDFEMKLNRDEFYLNIQGDDQSTDMYADAGC